MSKHISVQRYFRFQFACILFNLLNLSLFFSIAHGATEKPDEIPEIDAVYEIIEQDSELAGVLFHIREFDEEAYYWLASRLEYYVGIIRNRHPDLPIAVVSHGDEILALTKANQEAYASTHNAIRRMVNDEGVDFHVCGAFAEINNLYESDFPEYIDLVPFGPATLTDYRQLGFEIIDMELTW